MEDKIKVNFRLGLDSCNSSSQLELKIEKLPLSINE
jgi:hypothetical protein